jgi:hypothetical protein
MRRLIAACLLVLSTLAIQTAQARLGWTMEQCEKLYGPVYIEVPSKVGEHIYKWKKDDIAIYCTLIENKVVEIEYHSEFHKDEIESLLDKNAAGAQWQYSVKRGDDGVQSWKQWDGYIHGRLQVVAQYNEGDDPCLVITYLSQLNRQNERDNAPGL